MRTKMAIIILVVSAGVAKASEYDKIALEMSKHVQQAGRPFARFEAGLKTLKPHTAGYGEAGATYLWLKLLSSTLLLESTLVGVPSKMSNADRIEYTKLVDRQLRFANETFQTTANVVRNSKGRLPTQELASSMQEALSELEEGQSYIGNFLALHGALQPGDPINAQIETKPAAPQ